MKKNKYMGISKVGEKGQIVIKSDVIEAATNNILGGSNDKDK